MNRYQPSKPYAAFGLFAIAMTAFTIAIAVVVPANMDVSAQQERLLSLNATSINVQHVGSSHAKTQG